MAIRVLIKRQLKKGSIQEVIPLLNKLRAEAIGRSGYVTGQTLIGYDDPKRLLVISTWNSFEDWLAWKESAERKANDKALEKYLEGPSEYEAYHFGVSSAGKS